jgi:two-component sensor histidine kinase
LKGQKNRKSKTTTARAVAELDHEIGNVVNGLLGMARLVRDSGLTAEQEYWLKAIEQSGRQLGRLIEAFRQHGASGDWPVIVQRTRLDGVDLLEQILISHAPAARAGGNQLLLSVSQRLSRSWRADPCLLRQVLDNLLSNAIKFTRGGSVVLEAAVQRGDPAARGTLVLTVSDSGPGIDEEVGLRMFEAYQRGPGASGRGLGLSICRNIVLAMGAEITWSSPGQGGACFELRLPDVVEQGAKASLPAPRLLRSLHCRLRLTGALLGSVAAMLSRLGVRWSLEGAAGARLGETHILIEQAPAGPANPGPNLLLRAVDPAGATPGVRRLRAPILECTLGPKLLQMALESVSAADAGQD